MATQFHPEKSGAIGTAIIKGFLENAAIQGLDERLPTADKRVPTALSKRIIAYVAIRMRFFALLCF